LVLIGVSSFCQNDSLPNKMISFTTSFSFSYGSIQDYNVNESWIFIAPPPPNTLTELDGQATTHDVLNFYENISFDKRIVHYNHNSIFLTTGLTYKYLTADLTYQTHESRSPTNNINGNGKTVWYEHYLSPTIGVSLYSEISKKIYLENNISLDYNYVLSGKETVNYKGSQYNPGQNNVQSYERHQIITYSHKKRVGNLNQFIAHQFNAYYKLGINYLYNNMMIGVQFALPLPNLKNKSIAISPNQDNPSSLLYNKELYRQITFALNLKLYFK